MPAARRGVRVKIVADTNTLVSGFLRAGPSAQLVTAAMTGRVRLCSSTALLLELEEVLQRPKFAARLLARGETPAGIVERYRQASIRIIPREMIPPESLRDLDDLHVLGCAVAARADVVVSGDKDLLVLRSFADIPILTSAEVLERLLDK
jgi:putative PIN family toxin of toxin-antitoxin system